MKNVFIINPVAGQGNGTDELEKEIRRITGLKFQKCEIYHTEYKGDAISYVRNMCNNAEHDEKLRFFACGGDGTLNEVLNGMYGFENASLGVIPNGTGNDFLRNFGEASDFRNIERQISGKEKKIDVIEYINTCNGLTTDAFLINMVNIGFDANVANLTGTLKQKPFISGSLAYLIGVAIMIVRKKGADIKALVGNDLIKEGKVLLCAVTNGCYCGGGVKGIPRAVTDDGLLDISIVNNVSRRKFIKLFPDYSKGTHLDTEDGRRLVDYRQETEACIIMQKGPVDICIDGERTPSDRIELKIADKKINFIIP